MNYPIARYRFECVQEQTLRLPLYSGSMLRGAFGSALRKIVCVTGRKLCEGCPINSTCSYTTIFEPGESGAGDRRKGPPAYVVEPPPMGVKALSPGDRLEFNMVVFGKALAQMPLIILAWQRALAQGLGKRRTPSRLARVIRCGVKEQEEIWSEEQPQVCPHGQAVELMPPVDARRISLRVETPLRLLRQGKVLGAAEVTPADLVAGCLRRSRLFLKATGPEDNCGDIRELIERAKTLSSEHNLKHASWSRYSSRQRQKMDLPGLVGDWHITGELRPFLPSLYLCELLHVGKNASFGLGKYTIEGVT
jgi:hypothetical protein